MEIFLNLVHGFVDSFKQKNPFVFLVIAFIGLVGAGALDTLVNSSMTMDDGTVVHLVSTNVGHTLIIIRNGIVFFLTIIGAHTPKRVESGLGKGGGSSGLLGRKKGK